MFLVQPVLSVLEGPTLRDDLPQKSAPDGKWLLCWRGWRSCYTGLTSAFFAAPRLLEGTLPQARCPCPALPSSAYPWHVIHALRGKAAGKPWLPVRTTQTS